jgi:DNA-binding XRE family transcriptional regulator
MNLDKYIDERLTKEEISKEEFWDGYEDFKIGVFLKEIRVSNGLTQEELARRINTTKSVISRMENHSEDVKLSTLEKVAKALGKRVKIAIM